MNNPELHLIVLWSKARYKEKEITEDINKNLKIVECIDVEWSKNKVAENYTRFYGVKLPARHGKPKECGYGNFLLFTVLDENPNYEYVETSRGFDLVNTNIFNLKQKYRTWTGGGAKIHATNSVKETNHDITLLLGTNYNDYLKNAPKDWNGEIKQIKRDLSGANGWKNLAELFYNLNATVNYVVLRGIDNLNEFEINKVNGDIDIFTDDYKNTKYIVNGKPACNEFRPHFLTKICDKSIYLDLWNCENNYYDTKWQNNMLENRQITNGFYQLDDENSFYELIYHCLMHKTKIADIYYLKAKALFEKLGLNRQYNIKEYKYPFDLYHMLLKKFMKENNYSFVVPDDCTVQYNHKLLKFDEIISWLNNKYKISNINPYMINIKNDGSGYIYFTGYFNDTKLFIKYGGILNSVINEYKISKKMYDINNRHFIKPCLYHFDSDKNFIAFEFIDGVGIDFLIENNLMKNELKVLIVKQAEEIALCLFNADVIHRDISPNNLLIIKNSDLKLIDFQFAIDYKKSNEDFVLKNNPKLIHSMGGRFAKGHYDWDDMYSFSIIMKGLNIQSQIIENLVNKKRIKHPILKAKYWVKRIIIYFYKLLRFNR